MNSRSWHAFHSSAGAHAARLSATQPDHYRSKCYPEQTTPATFVLIEPRMDPAPSRPIYQVGSSPYELIRYAEAKLVLLRSLKEGWDGDKGMPITTNAALAMYEVLQKLADRRTVFPYLSPDGEGGVLAEWHARAQKLEIEIDADGNGTFFATDHDGHVVLQDDVNPKTEHRLRRLLLDLSARVDQENPTWRELFAR